MKLPQCVYPSEKDCGKCSEPLKKTFNSLWFALDGRLDLDNISEDMFDEDSFVINRTPVAKGGTRRRLINRLTDSKQETYLIRKEDSSTGLINGMELHLPDAGRFCLVSTADKTRQILSIILDASASNAGAKIVTNYGSLVLDNNEYFIIKSGGVTKVSMGSTSFIFSINVGPNADNTYDLGDGSIAWKTVWCRRVDTPNTDLVLSRNGVAKLTLASTAATLVSHLNPNADTTYDLGASSTRWRELFAVTIDSGASDMILQRNNVTRVTITDADADFAGSVDTNVSFKVGGTKVVGEQGSSVADPSGGATQDAEARATIAVIIDRLQAHGLIA